MNSRNKGANGEREAAEFLRAHGFEAKRGQQHAGGVDSPDVITDLPFHVEVKRVEKLNLESACDQARKDSAGGQWIVLHRKNRKPWLVTLDAETFLNIVKK